MSGALSIPFALAAFQFEGHERRLFAILAFCALWVLTIRLAWKNYQIMMIDAPQKRNAIFTAMVDAVLKDSSLGGLYT